MPLIKSRKKADIERNIHEMISAGHPPDQAAAAAYQIARDAGSKTPKKKSRSGK